MVAARRSSSGVRRPLGYNLVALAVLVTVMNIAVAAVLPELTQAMQREKEEELIFRGLQYAEAIRVFQKRTGRFPTHLNELLEVEPRSIRQLWTDPFRDDGKWGVVIAQTGRGESRDGRGEDGDGGTRTAQRLRQAQRQRVPDGEEPPIPTQTVGEEGKRAGRQARQGTQVSGPIMGVRSVEELDTVKTFLDASRTDQWIFTVEMIPALPAATLGDNVPRLNSRWIGRPFPAGVEPQEGAAPDDPLEKASDDRRRRNDRRSRDRNGNQPDNRRQ